MPYSSRRILVSLCPFVNLDLFKKGHYHIDLRLVDKNGEENHSRVECLEVKDLLNPGINNQFTYPGACLLGDHFITQTSLVEYTEQSFPLGESFLFKLDCPIKNDHMDAYIPSSLLLHMELKFSADEDLPEDPLTFSTVSARTVHFSVDWSKGLHYHYPVLFDYFHLAAVGVTIHASLHELCLEDFNIPLLHSQVRQTQRRQSRSSIGGRRWSFQASPSVPLPSLHCILFGADYVTEAVPPLPVPGTSRPLRSFSVPDSRQGNRSLTYLANERRIERAQDAQQALCNILITARESLHSASSDIYSQLPPVAEDDASLREGTGEIVSTLEEVERMCINQVTRLNDNLAISWEWFCNSVVQQPDFIPLLAASAHHQHLLYCKDTFIAHDHPFLRNMPSMDGATLSVVAGRVRKSLAIPMTLYCKENVETSLNSSIIFVEPPPWPALEESSHPLTGDPTPLDHLPGTAPGLQGFTRYVPPYLMDFLPQASRSRRKPTVHLVVCVHGLQGNQFDLRLYRIFLTMALPHVRFSFLMSSANQGDTFCDFNLMTDRLLEEILEHVRDMPTPPSKVSFIGHSLGSIIVRSLVTRPEFASLNPKLHLYMSICGPHLGTKYQNGIISIGMWAVRKWYNSKSLLQLSLKDAPNPCDSFLYQLSEAPSLEGFRHIILLASPQDKYVPYHSAKISTLSRDAGFQSSVSLRIMQNILEPLRRARVNLVRMSVDHAIPTSANSVIGRAAHIAMLDNELFIRKVVTLHLTQYFVEP